MIDRSILVPDLQRLLKKLEADLRVRAEQVGEIDSSLQAQHREAVAAKRTGEPFKEWREEIITQVGVAWILGCVFVRFLEDNAFLDAPFISGAGDNLGRARDQHTAYVRKHPTDSDREYLQYVFETVATLPILGALYDKRHNPLWLFGPSADGAQMLLTFWPQADAATGALRHDFTDPNGDTRFLGDLYQDMSESARKRYALLQTPVFVEEFILDRTLDPAIETFGLAKVRMIDPTCGSGHFLLGGFHRLFDRWQRTEPATNVVELVRRALAAVHGVDLNPFAVAIARFRLLIAALRAAGIARVRSVPAWSLNVFTGDALLFGPEPGQQVAGELLVAAVKGAYRTEDAEEATRVLSQRYHAVVGNPPYITVDDRVAKAAIKERFKSCHGKWVLVVPFFERFFDLAERGDGTARQPAGFVGKITGNNFMKREFGKKLVESFIPGWDLTHIIDTAGAYLPGHGTPTVIVFGRHQRPVASTVRVVMGIKGEPSTPEDPSRGRVWGAIVEQLDLPKSESEFVSVADTPRENFYSHPWSIGGGGASELKEFLDAAARERLDEFSAAVGVGIVTLEDEPFLDSVAGPGRAAFGRAHQRALVEGDGVREWVISGAPIVFPYSGNEEPDLEESGRKFLWPWKPRLRKRLWFQKTQDDRNLAWFEYGHISWDKFRTPLAIPFGEVASHNHFVLDRGGKVFNRTAPIIKLPPRASEDDHLGLLGLLNSSTACFWLKQVCFPKGGDHQGSEGARVRTTLWDERYAFNSTQVGGLPLPAGRPLERARELDRYAQMLQAESPAALIQDANKLHAGELENARQQYERILRRMFGLQEDLDWEVYALYGLTPEPVCPSPPLMSGSLNLGERAFEIALARKIAEGKEQSAWFERHGITPITEVPNNGQRELVERRLNLIATDKNIALIERPEYKRRWNLTPWEEQLTTALRTWLLDRLELLSHPNGVAPQLFSVHELAERTRSDGDFQRVAEIYSGRPDFDLSGLVADLVGDESVPSLPGQRYKESGLRKREQWEDTWKKQRMEDAVTARIAGGKNSEEMQNPKLQQEIRSAVAKEVGEIPVPPKYTSADFLKSSFWRLRGKLDVPKERWVSYPGAERAADQSLVLAWAGWTHLQQAQAIAAHYERLRNEGASESQLARLLASLQQLVAWLLQWHNDLDPEFQLKMGDYFKTFIEDESRRLHNTSDDLVQLAMMRS